MNSKNLFILFFVSLLFGCGVKAPPRQYPDTSVDSYVREYTGTTELTPEELERTKDKPPVSSVEDQVKRDENSTNNTSTNRK